MTVTGAAATPDEAVDTAERPDGAAEFPVADANAVAGKEGRAVDPPARKEMGSVVEVGAD